MVNSFCYSQKEDSLQVNEDNKFSDLYYLSLDELLNLEVSSATLTDVKNNLSPVPSITISKEDILFSGAKNLDDLLLIYLPSSTLMTKGKTGNSFGVRGIISDRNNKVLLLT